MGVSWQLHKVIHSFTAAATSLAILVQCYELIY